MTETECVGTFEEATHYFINIIDKIATQALTASPGRDHLCDSEYAELKKAQENLKPIFDEFTKRYIDNLRESGEHHFAYQFLLCLVRSVFEIGSSCIMTESAKSFFAPEISAEARTAVATGGGKASGESRNKKAEDTWRTHALELARSARSREPGWSQEDIASDVISSWKLPETCPGHSSIKAFISKKIKSGELSDRVGTSTRRRI